MKFLNKLKSLFFPSQLYIANFYNAEGYLLEQRVIRAKSYKQAEDIAFEYCFKLPHIQGVYVEKIEEEI